MFHSPFPSVPAVIRMGLTGGAKTTKDKLMLAGLVVIILAAGFALTMSVLPKGKPVIGPDVMYIKCMNPACGNEWTMTRQEIKDLRASPQYRGGSDYNPTFPCPKCSMNTGSRMRKCPACETHYVSNRVKATYGLKVEEPEKCPKCGTVIADWIAAHPDYRDK